ncbi:DUF262 domain-containing protein [Pseudohongiella acticola]|jgi:Protein of unknown function DUF262|uniref:DUF262 domain-containing protein n=1 Tax=Pseudohongiella acticola TaxID=1524254 RepID=UPI0030EEAC23
MSNNTVELKPVSELLDKSFYIPSYQRGYRWTRHEVFDLLEDIGDFQQKSEEGPKSAFYCLQPIVVKFRDGEWELVDGQQRLTTIRLIFTYLKQIASFLKKSQYSLRYQTRPRSEEFLKNPNDAEHKNNIDYFHMYHAYETIRQWFEEKEEEYALKFYQTLTNDRKAGKNVQVIWYEIREDIDATAVFARLNMGKIPLTDSELVKALFLKDSNFNDLDKYHLQLKIAHEWDEMERLLQSDEFWFFVHNSPQESNRISIVLTLVADLLPSGINDVSRGEEHYIFHAFSNWLGRGEIDPVEAWTTVKRVFMTVKEWYEDHRLFHLVGFLVSRDVPLRDLLKKFQECATKIEFQKYLLNRICRLTMPGVEVSEGLSLRDLEISIGRQLSQIAYSSSSENRRIKAILLMFNIATVLSNQKSNYRFQFDRFKNESWDIEHIRSVATEMPESKERQRIWLQSVADYIDEVIRCDSESGAPSVNKLKKISQEANTVLSSSKFDSYAFEKIFQSVLDAYVPGGGDETDHTIGNLTLLDTGTNRSYQNSIFPLKRNRIIGLDRTATFIPVCTKNVFLKYYSENAGNMIYWSPADSANYLRAVVSGLAQLFVEEGVLG